MPGDMALVITVVRWICAGKLTQILTVFLVLKSDTKGQERVFAQSQCHRLARRGINI